MKFSLSITGISLITMDTDGKMEEKPIFLCLFFYQQGLSMILKG